MDARDLIFTKRILILINLDAQGLFERLKSREVEYLSIFSQKRTREHFKEIFRSRYDNISISDLKYCEENIIYALDSFYGKVEEMKWYIYHTEDMPGTVDERVRHFLKEIEGLYETLSLHINAELNHGDEETTLSDDEVPPIGEEMITGKSLSCESESERSPTKNLDGEDTILGVFNLEDLEDLKK